MTPIPEPSPDKPRRRFPRVTAMALCVAIVALAVAMAYGNRFAFFGEPGAAEIKALSKYSLKNRFSRDYEELIIRDFFQDRRDGIFLDVGANHYRDESNTYFLETQLGWSGVAIDAIAEFGADYASHRPRTKFVAMFASDVADTTVQFFVPRNHLVASANREFTERHGAAGAGREVPTTTLNAVLDQAGLSRIDFLTMDIELAEPKALAGFDIARFQPSLVCIEGHPEVRQQILEYFTSHRYVLVGKYLRIDPHNLYFQPMPQRAP